MLSFSKSLGEKICKLFSSLDITHLGLLLLNALADEEVPHCNVLGLLVISRVISKAQRAFVVTKKASPVNMKTDRIKQILDKNNFTQGIRQCHEPSVLRGASNQVDHSRPPGDGSPYALNIRTIPCRLAVIQLTSPVSIKNGTHHIWELTGEMSARVDNTSGQGQK